MLKAGLLAAVAGLAIGASACATETAFTSDRITVETQGSGDPVVFIPGLTSSPDVFRDAAKGVNGEVHFVTVKGFDGTEAPASLNPFIVPVADAIASYLEAEDLTGAAVIGHSMGGVLAMLTAAQSDRVGQVMIVDSVPFLPGLFQPNATPERAAMMASGMRAQMANMTQEQWVANARQGLQVQSLSEEGRALVLDDVERSDAEAAKAAFVELMTTDYSASYADVDVPVTVLVPFDPSVGFPKEAVLGRYQAQYAPFENVTLTVVEPSRHFIMIDAPEAFSAQLDEFLGE